MTPAGIDPRGPRIVATITAVLTLLATFLGLVGESASRIVISDSPSTDGGWGLPSAPLDERVVDPAFLLTLVIAALFLWGVLSPRTQPWAVLFRTVVRPRLSAPKELEDPRPPRFAQGVGLIVVVVGLVLQLLGVPLALPIATAAAFVAAFLNAAFGFCLGCELYLLLRRAGVLRGGIA